MGVESCGGEVFAANKDESGSRPVWRGGLSASVQGLHGGVGKDSVEWSAKWRLQFVPGEANKSQEKTIKTL